MNWEESFLASLPPGLKNTPGYKIDKQVVSEKLDQNESPEDWPQEAKQSVLKKLSEMKWNHYPDALSVKLETQLASFLGVDPKCLISTNGSDRLVALVVNFCHILGKSLVIADPTFPLYRARALYLGVDHQMWPLTEDFEYDLSSLPNLGPKHVVCLATPNNPLGNVLSSQNLKKLLTDHPQTTFVIDEAYYEFADEELLRECAHYPNLLLIRTFSKTMSSAGIRFGYAVGHPLLIEHLRKLRLPYSLNHFTMAAIQTLLDEPKLKQHMNDVVAQTRQQRSELFKGLTQSMGTLARVFDSQANFITLQFPDQAPANSFYNYLLQQGVLVRNISNKGRLKGCLRVTVGSQVQNKKFVDMAKTYRNSL